MKKICILSPQLKRASIDKMLSKGEITNSDYEYFTICDGKATIIKGEVKDIHKKICAEIIISRDLGKIQFGYIKEKLSLLKIDKQEIIDFINKQEDIYLSSRTEHFTDKFYFSEYNENVLVANLSIPFTTGLFCFYKTKYGIEFSTYSKYVGSFKAQHFRVDENKMVYEVNFKDWHQPQTIREWGRIDGEIRFFEVTGWASSSIYGNRKDFFEIIEDKEIFLTKDDDLIEVEGLLFNGGFDGFNVKNLSDDINTTLGNYRKKYFIEKHPEKNFEKPLEGYRFDSIAYRGIMRGYNNGEFYGIEVTHVGEVSYTKKIEGYCGYGNADERRNGVDS